MSRLVRTQSVDPSLSFIVLPFRNLPTPLICFHLDHTIIYNIIIIILHRLLFLHTELCIICKVFRDKLTKKCAYCIINFLGITKIVFLRLTQGHVLSDGEPIQDVGFLLFSKTVTQKVC